MKLTQLLMRKLKMPETKRIPDRCDICQDKIGLYEPWYSIIMQGHHCLTPKLKQAGEKGYLALCPVCFQAYENFIIEHETQENHKRHMKDIKGV